MKYPYTSHIALNVADLRVAESYYRDLLDLEVAWRDTDGPTSMYATWEQIEAEGAAPVAIMLGRDKLRLALARIETEGPGIGHVQLEVSLEHLASLRARVNAKGLSVLATSGMLLVFRDDYGVEWELSTRG